MLRVQQHHSAFLCFEAHPIVVPEAVVEVVDKMKLINSMKRKSMNLCSSSMVISVLLALLLLNTGQSHAVESITFFHNDVLGSPVATTDENGNICWVENYKPYGDKLENDDGHESSTAGCGLDDNQIGYTGHVHDKDIGLTYMQARYYDPVVGRFMGVDPIGPRLSEQVSFNRYAYGNNNPYKYLDPDGKDPIGDMGDGLSGNSDDQDGDGISDAEEATLSISPKPEYELNGLTIQTIGGAPLSVLKMPGPISGSTAVPKGTADLTKSQLKGVKSLEKQIQKHQQKLADFKANPTVRPGMENLPKDVIKKQQQARVKHLETEINTFKNNINKIKNGEL